MRLLIVIIAFVQAINRSLERYKITKYSYSTAVNRKIELHSPWEYEILLACPLFSVPKLNHSVVVACSQV